MRIQELERLVGIERATIRYYEKEGLITPDRSENGYRDYSDDDAQELRRIKLMRELGISLDTIRSLQQGTEDFTAVMERQSRILEGRREQMERARAVCQRISADGVTYAQMDIQCYQNLLNAPLLPKPAGQGSGSAIFEEKEFRTPHPWRRFFARFLDYQIVDVLLWCFLVFVLRWRVNSALYAFLISYAAWFVMIPLEATWLHFCGTTPGKWIFGIRVEAAVGGKLSYRDALLRSWTVFRRGMGFNIVIWNLCCFYMSYRAHKDDWYTEWDEDCEITFREEFCWVNVVMAIAVLVAASFADMACQWQMRLPRYQRDELTIAQFAENYNYFDEVMFGGLVDPMDREGVITERNYTENMVIDGYGELEYDPFAQFEYRLDGDVIKSISFRHTWYERDWFSTDSDGPIDQLGYWIPYHCMVAIHTAIVSQKGISVEEYYQFNEAYVNNAVQSCSDGMTGTYGNVTCTWDLDLEKYLDNDEEAGQADVYEVTLDLKIEFP